MVDIIISIIPTLLIALIGVMYIYIGFELYLNLANGYENDFGLPNLGGASSAALGMFWLPLLLLVIFAMLTFIIIVGGSKIAMFKLGA